MSRRAIVNRLNAANAGRDPERLARKFEAMRRDAFTFLRGTCPLFYEDLELRELPPAPSVWCCGDLHLQNFGAYKGENRLVYFDINDLDEACLAPATWDLVRMVASLVISSPGESDPEAFLSGYREALQAGRIGWVERATSQGEIRELLARLKKRSRRKFLRARTVFKGARRSLLIDGEHTLALEPGAEGRLRAFLETFAPTHDDPRFFRYLDAARRLAGNGSLGLPRYVLLVEGRGAPDGHFLLDLKLQPGPAVAPLHGIPQPKWESPAQRVVAAQQMVQAAPPALLQPVSFEGGAWVLRELAPTKDRLAPPVMRETLRTLGRIVAWGHLRSAARFGSSLPADLIGFGHDAAWVTPLLKLARRAAARTDRQWREFRNS